MNCVDCFSLSFSFRWTFDKSINSQQASISERRALSFSHHVSQLALSLNLLDQEPRASYGFR